MSRSSYGTTEQRRQFRALLTLILSGAGWGILNPSGRAPVAYHPNSELGAQARAGRYRTA
jgi:hypothetical protein